ncbi:hypothetical protein [Streptomyces sp. 135]|uniref:hypothetical protein n=1 Tax=Streptomyces sp. 135 TaxID=2838850 RepID=UPI001CBAFC5C|nr:hypothetical protein [Streptomyces sp. 135]
MSTTTTTARPASTERAVAIAASLAPVATGVLAPWLDGGAAFTASAAYLGAATLTGANYMNRIPAQLAQELPGADILAAHRTSLGISTLTTGMALGIGTLLGGQGADALMAGVLTLPSVPGIVSLGWWAAVALVPYKLRKVLARKHTAHHLPARPAHAPTLPPTQWQLIMQAWAKTISHPENGTNKGQVLSDLVVRPKQWTGTITAPAGIAVNVTKETVSSVYRVDPAWIRFAEGAHAGQRRITVNLVAPADLDTSTLEGAWAKWVAPRVMKGSHLEEVQPDPMTGGEVAYVVADDDTARLPVPDREDLAGALRTTTLLCAYTRVPGDPRRGKIRIMQHNPLEDGVPFPGIDVLKASKGGYVQIGRHVSGRPARLQFTDPILGARHIFIAGVTGSGKGGLCQIIALADHANGHAIIYGDPKGSSNPDIVSMAAYSGLGEEGCMGALRVGYALMKWRIAESGRLGMKNFIATPDRPWVRMLLDEAHVPLTELGDDEKREAKIILEAMGAKSRSLGIPLGIVNQAINAEKLGGSTPLRTNLIQGGSLVLLRTDSDQSSLASTGFEGIDPGQIPATWNVEEPLVFTEDTVLQDPRSTFGLGYTLGPGGVAEMMRTFILESAAPYVDHDRIAYPADWPDWEHRHEIAATRSTPTARAPHPKRSPASTSPRPPRPRPPQRRSSKRSGTSAATTTTSTRPTSRPCSTSKNPPSPTPCPPSSARARSTSRSSTARNSVAGTPWAPIRPRSPVRKTPPEPKPLPEHVKRPLPPGPRYGRQRPLFCFWRAVKCPARDIWPPPEVSRAGHWVLPVVSRAGHFRTRSAAARSAASAIRTLQLLQLLQDVASEDAGELRIRAHRCPHRITVVAARLEADHGNAFTAGTGLAAVLALLLRDGQGQ